MKIRPPLLKTATLLTLAIGISAPASAMGRKPAPPDSTAGGGGGSCFIHARSGDTVCRHGPVETLRGGRQQKCVLLLTHTASGTRARVSCY